MPTPLRKPPGLCEVCGVFVPLDRKRPFALHVCPGHRVVPRMPGSPARLDELMSKFKLCHLLGNELDDDEKQELETLLDEFPTRYSQEGLENWMERVDNRKAIERLAEAARIVIAKYDQVIPADFLNAVRTQFLEQTVESERPCTCFMWHKSENAWAYRFRKLGLTKPAGEVTGMTPFWDKQESVALPVKLAGNFPPLNRSIEFPKPKLDTLVHEMIHWCTSPEYDRYTGSFEGNDKALVREGTTEWLKCHATGVFGTGGYVDVLPEIQALLKQGVVTETQLIRAYLGGEDVKATVDALVSGFHARQQEKSDAAMQKVNEGERKLLAGQINDGGTAYGVARRSKDYRDRVFKAFGGMPATERERALKSAPWRKYLAARDAGKDDAQALADAVPK